MRNKLLIAGALAAFLAAPVAAQDVRNTYIAVAAQIADGIITLAKLTGLGTGVATALGINVGTSGAVLVKGTSVCGDLSDGGTGCSTAVTAPATYTPSVACGTGAGTWTVNSARYSQLGKWTFYSLDATLSTVGTCAGTSLSFTAPSTAASGGGAAGREINVAGTGVNCNIANATVTCFGPSLLGNFRVMISGSYESQ